ncbi:transposase, partial [Thiolapillus sp.]|uniref:IS66 family transposase n=1 Tax=Thiolapillus sp. TaxID=2017437 RepID=UPI0035A897D7
KAIQYTLNQWELLTGYLADGRLHISNALAENAIRPFAVGRRNWLFADTPRGAKASATIYSLIETAKANGLEPFRHEHDRSARHQFLFLPGCGLHARIPVRRRRQAPALCTQHRLPSHHQGQPQRTLRAR